MARPDFKRYSPNKLEIECPICGEVFWRHPADIRNRGTVTCSRKCSYAAAKRKKTKYDTWEKTVEHFWSLVDKNPEYRGPKGDCWGWKGEYTHYGYGQIWIYLKKDRYLAHRVSLALRDGDLTYLDQPEIFACHTCDNPPCTNPEHLFKGDIFSNNLDRTLKGRTPRKFTVEEVAYMRASTKSNIELCRELGASSATVSRIRNYKERKHG